MEPSAPLLAEVFPSELTALRAGGLIAAVLTAAFAIWRRRTLRNVDVLILLLVALGLAFVSGTELTNTVLEAFSFNEGNGERIIGVAVFAILILFLLVLRALSQSSRISRELSAALEGIAWEEFRNAGLPERFRGKVAVVIPSYNEEENLGYVLSRIPPSSCGLGT